MGGSTVGLGQVRRATTAVARVNRLSTTLGYNAAYLLLGLGLGASTGTLTGHDLRVAGTYALAAMLTKMAASVADAIHDQAVDAIDAEKCVVAEAVDVLGVDPAWSLLVTELAVGMAGFGYVALLAGRLWPIATGLALALLGMWYSYPPRLKECGVANHLVTTAADVGLFVLPIGALAGEGVTGPFLVVGAVVFCYVFAYHLVHQAADVHTDRTAGVTTFATRAGVGATVALAAATTAAAGGLALALESPLAPVGPLAATALYVRIYVAVAGERGRARSEAVAARFDVGWVATGLNLAMALAVWHDAAGVTVL